MKIPPLRERPEDIPLLIDMALERFNLRYGKKIRGFSSEALQLLLGHSYLGNVRELLNIVEQTVILCRNGEIELEHLPAGLLQSADNSGAPATTGQPSREKLADLIARHNGNRSQVARELGVDRTTLWRWMKRLDLTPL